MLIGNKDIVVYFFDETKKNYSLDMMDFMSIEFLDQFCLYPGDIQSTVSKFVSKHEGRVKCDIIFIDRTLPTEVVRANLKDFRRLANRVENLVVMDAHPHNTDSNIHDVWQEFVDSNQLIEHFRCYFANYGDVGKERGITVGSFGF